MKRLLKLKVLITIALISCLSSSLQSRANTSFSTGGVYPDDSVLVSYNDLRSANAKIIELKYTKEINSKLKDIIKNDSIIQVKQANVINTTNKKVKRFKNERNVFAGVSIISILAVIISVL